MLTGDHLATATAIAQQVGIIGKDFGHSTVMTGPQFDALSEEEIDALPQLPRVLARCAPETKVRMVEALHRRKRMCVMTGDGVNDAPSLKRSDVGVAMGLNGSDVAKQSAEIVLADDNFSTIITAIRKGRGIFFNLKKFLLYLLSGNLAEVLILMIGLAFIDERGESTFPISPVAALWINTLAAGPPAYVKTQSGNIRGAYIVLSSGWRSVSSLHLWTPWTGVRRILRPCLLSSGVCL